MKNFILVGACGYIAPKHFQAIKETKNNLVAAFDITQNAGVIDKYFPKSNFFFNFNEFKKFISKYQKRGKIDYMVICTPNYLHYKYILFGLKNKINIICEKPLILNTAHLKKINKYQKKYKKKVFCIMQLRLNKKIIDFKKEINNKVKKIKGKKLECKINYVSYRGDWFLKSWKGDTGKSGGLTTNIGIHLFDLLSWFFGNYIKIKIIKNTSKTNVGVISFKNANVKWLISISDSFLKTKNSKKRSIREFFLNGKRLELSDNFTNMHVLSYKKILLGKGFVIKDVINSLFITEELRKYKLNR